MKRLRVGIVGFDHPHVLRYAPALARRGDVEVAWIAEDGPNRAPAQAMAARIGCRRLAEPDEAVDAVYLANRPGRHRESVERFAPRGVHILCDKPIALTREDGRAIVETASRAGVKLMVPFNPRFQLGPRAVRERIDRGELGEIRLLHAVKCGKLPLGIPGLDLAWFVDPREGRFGGFGDIGIHALDAMRWLLGREARRVFAVIHKGVRPDLAVDTIGTATIEWDGGAVSTLTAGWVNPAGFPSFLDARFEVVGTKAAAWVDRPYQDFRVSDGERSDLIPAWRSDLEGLIEAFVTSVLRDRPPPITGEDGVKALELLLACYRSAECGEPVEMTG